MVLAALLVVGLLTILGGVRPLDAIDAWLAGSRPPIVVGLIHSRTGSLATAEAALLDAEILALEEINAQGGVAGRMVRWEVGDGRSDPTEFEAQARRLIETEKAVALFGGYSAECRKAMLPVVERNANLLFFPANYEGMEASPRVVYSGGAANQSVVPAVHWCVDSLKARRFFVAGSEELWSRAAGEIAKDQVKAAAGELVGEGYLLLGSSKPEALVAAIAQAKPDVVLSTVVGDSNIAFFAALRRAGLTSERVRVITFGVDEDALKRVSAADAAGHYAAWNYFQAIDRPKNREFIARFRARYGPERSTSDAIVAAYNAVWLWARSVKEAETPEPSAILFYLGRQSLDGPEGVVTIDPESRVVWRPFHIGRARADRQFDIVWSLEKPIHPRTFTLTRSKADWRTFVDSLRERWSGRWSGPPG
jgi:urea transport system substrate-binding protein